MACPPVPNSDGRWLLHSAHVTNPTFLKVEPKRCSPALLEVSFALCCLCVVVGNLSLLPLPKRFGVTLLAQYLELHIPHCTCIFSH